MTTNESLPNSYAPQVSEPGKPERSNWTEARVALGVWVVSISLILFVPIFMVIPYMVHLARTTGITDPATLVSDKGFIFLSILGVFPAHFETFALIWLVVTNAGRVPFIKAVRLEWPESIRPIWGIALCVLMSLMLLSLAGVLTYFFGDKKTDLDMIVDSSVPARWVTAIAAFFTAPIVEESLYRGLLYPAFEKGFKSIVSRGWAMAWAIVVVSVLFAGVHVWQYRNNLAVISVIVLLSVSLTLIRALSGKLMPCFVIHLVFNGIQSAYLIKTIKGDFPAPPPAPSLNIFVDLIRFFS